MASLGALWIALGCSAPPESFAGDGWGRPSDDLLDHPTLQEVVGAQIRRDAPALVAYLGSEDPAVRARAAFALGSVQDLNARAALLEVLDDPDPQVRADAAFAIGQMSDTTGTRVLVDRLREETDPNARVQLIQAAGKAGGREVATLFMRRDIEESELATFALALARLGNRGVNNALAVERLLGLIDHSDPTVRRNAAFYFGRSASPSFWSPVVPRLRERLAALGPSDPAAMWVLRALAKLNNPIDTETGVTWLREATDWRTRHAAANLLMNRQANGAVVTALMGALSDTSSHVRQAAAAGIAHRSRRLTEEHGLFLRTWIAQHEDDLKTVGALLPAWVGLDAMSVLDWGDRFPPESPQRAVALEALGVLPGLEIVEREFSAAGGGGPTASVGLRALENRIPAANAERLQRIFDIAESVIMSDDPSKVQLGSALLSNSRLAPLGSIQALGTALAQPRDEGVTRTLYRALAAMNDPAALPLLESGLRSQDAEVQEIAALGLEAQASEVPPYQPVTRPVPAVDWQRLSELGRHPQVVFETLRGPIVIELDTEQAPLTAQTFVDLVQAGALDGVPFHRVVPAFMVQGGDVMSGDGFGWPPRTIRSEFTRLPFDQGVLGMASSGKDTEGSQFFVTHLVTPHLDGGYTSFGRVVSGQDVLDQIVRGDELVRARLTPPS